MAHQMFGDGNNYFANVQVHLVNWGLVNFTPFGPQIVPLMCLVPGQLVPLRIPIVPHQFPNQEFFNWPEPPRDLPPPLYRPRPQYPPPLQYPENEDNRSIPECPICIEQYSLARPPAIGTCGHSLCFSCVERLPSRKNCPTCRARGSYHRPMKNYLAETCVEKLLEKERRLKRSEEQSLYKEQQLRQAKEQNERISEELRLAREENEQLRARMAAGLLQF